MVDWNPPGSFLKLPMADLRFFKSPVMLFQLTPNPPFGPPPKHMLGLLNFPNAFKILPACPNKLAFSCGSKSGIFGA